MKIKEFFNHIKEILRTDPYQKMDEVYLSEAVDLSDLEKRMKDIIYGRREEYNRKIWWY